MFTFLLGVLIGAFCLYIYRENNLEAVKAAIAKTEAEFEKQIVLAGPAIIARIKDAL
jgi:hypothetical protein